MGNPKILDDYGFIIAILTTFVIDRRGDVVTAYEGFRDQATFRVRNSSPLREHPGLAGRSPCKSARGGDRLPAQEPLVNEFAWPAASRPIDFDVQSHQGYSLCGWNKAGLN
jgi:hypothetical protein